MEFRQDRFQATGREEKGGEKCNGNAGAVGVGTSCTSKVQSIKGGEYTLEDRAMLIVGRWRLVG